MTPEMLVQMLIDGTLSPKVAESVGIEILRTDKDPKIDSGYYASHHERIRSIPVSDYSQGRLYTEPINDSLVLYFNDGGIVHVGIWIDGKVESTIRGSKYVIRHPLELAPSEGADNHIFLLLKDKHNDQSVSE